MSHWFYSVRECKVTAFCACFRADSNLMDNNKLQRGIRSCFGSRMQMEGGPRIHLYNLLIFRWLQQPGSPLVSTGGAD